MANFSENYRRALHFVLGNEGGVSNDKADRGGLTNMGVTQGALNNAYKQGIVSHNDPRKLTRDEAAAIYEANYWRPSHACDMPWPLCALHFDAAVNSGVGGAGKLLQRTLNKSEGAGLTVDGAVGPATLKALHAAIVKEDDSRIKRLCRAYCDAREALYNAIVANNPSQRRFLRGWLNRLARNRQLIS